MGRHKVIDFLPAGRAQGAPAHAFIIAICLVQTPREPMTPTPSLTTTTLDGNEE